MLDQGLGAWLGIKRESEINSTDLLVNYVLSVMCVQLL